jgi:shikimate kinase
MSAASPPPHDRIPKDRALAAIAARIRRPVVLVGLMGAGKSTVGRRLAAMLGRDFVDADEAIALAAQRSIPEIFETFGEAHFRDGERRVISRLLSEGHGVIATGGGAFVDPQTRAAVLENGIAVWIDCDIDTLVERTARRANRPLLRQGDPKEILTRLARERAPFYGEAHIRVQSETGPHADTARAIIKAIDQWL